MNTHTQKSLLDLINRAQCALHEAEMFMKSKLLLIARLSYQMRLTILFVIASAKITKQRLTIQQHLNISVYKSQP